MEKLVVILDAIGVLSQLSGEHFKHRSDISRVNHIHSETTFPVLANPVFDHTSTLIGFVMVILVIFTFHSLLDLL